MSKEEVSNEWRRNNGRRALRVLATIGGYSPFVIAVIMLVGLATSIIFGASYELIRDTLSHWVGETSPGWKTYVPLILLVLLMLSLGIHKLRYLAVEAAGDHPPKVSIHESAPAKALVLFLSMPSIHHLPQVDAIENESGEENLKRRVRAFLENLNTGDFLDAGWLEKEFGAMNWRMPLQAIRHHLTVERACLQQVVIIPSADDGERLGTHHLDEIFRDHVEGVLRRRFKDKPKGRVRVDRVADIVEQHDLTDADNRKTDLTKGVLFHDFKSLIHLLYFVFKYLKKSYLESEILVDITGGQKTNSVAAAVFAILVPTRRFQYIDTNSFDVRSFDVYHELDTLMPQ